MTNPTNIFAHRRARLQQLILERAAGDPTAFADAHGYTRAQIRACLQETCEMDWAWARDMESRVGLPAEWLDLPLHFAGTLAADAVQAAAAIPVEQLASAIAQTRHVFESEPAAGDVLEYLKAVLDSAPSVPCAAPPHACTGAGASSVHADDLAVDRFTAAMKAKLAACRAAGRGGWDNPEECEVEDLAAQLVHSIDKGDPLDVGNFAMMLHQRQAGASVLSDALGAYVRGCGGAPDDSQLGMILGEMRGLREDLARALARAAS